MITVTEEEYRQNTDKYILLGKKESVIIVNSKNETVMIIGSEPLAPEVVEQIRKESDLELRALEKELEVNPSKEPRNGDYWLD